MTLNLLYDLYETVYKHTGGDLSSVGEDLAYLVGAILKNTKVEWKSDRPLVQMLKHGLSNHPEVWNYIALEKYNVIRGTTVLDTFDSHEEAVEFIQEHDHILWDQCRIEEVCDELAGI